jgi:hypothetical protein
LSLNAIRGLAGGLAVCCFAVGTLMSHRFEEAFGHTLILAGAIIVSGLLISLAITDKDKK